MSKYPLKGADPATARKSVAKARIKPRTLVFYISDESIGVLFAQTLQFNLKQIGIDLDVKYYDFEELQRTVSTWGKPLDISSPASRASADRWGRSFVTVQRPIGFHANHVFVTSEGHAARV
jgi:ABC-type transport system substrate-binding protein